MTKILLQNSKLTGDKLKIKYKEWLSVWLNNYIKPSAKQRTYDTYSQMIEKRIVPKIGDCELGNLTPIALKVFVSEYFLYFLSFD